MNQSGATKFVVAGCILLALAGGWYWLGRGYAEISDEGYQYAMAMTSACNRQDLKRVQTIVQQVRQASQAGELPQYDVRVLEQIARWAESGEWRRASDESRRLLKAQVSSV